MALDDKTLSGGTTIAINMNFLKEKDLNSIKDIITLSRGVTWTSGAGENAVQILFHDKYSLDAAGEGNNHVFNLVDDATLFDHHGDVITFSALKFVYVKNKSADATLLLLGGATPIPICSNLSDIIEIPPGGEFLWTCPTAAGLVLGANKNLKIEHNGDGSDPMPVELVVMGLD